MSLSNFNLHLKCMQYHLCTQYTFNVKNWITIFYFEIYKRLCKNMFNKGDTLGQYQNMTNTM